MSPPKNPSALFYFNDWDNDPELKTCSLAAQGLWMRLLCVAARSPEPGVVQIGSLPCGLPDGLPHLAAAVGRPPQEIAPLLDELVASGTASCDRRGRLFNRRMKRTAALARKRAVSGQKGAAVRYCKTERIEGLPWQNPGNPVGKPPPSSRLSASNLLPHGEIGGVAPRAVAPDGTRAGASPMVPMILTGASSLWKIRLLAHRPGAAWNEAWGPAPESGEDNANLDAAQRRQWRRYFGLEAEWRARVPAPDSGKQSEGEMAEVAG